MPVHARSFRLLRLAGLGALLLAGPPPLAQEDGGAGLETELRPPPAPGEATAAAMSAEDLEIVENLELLEAVERSGDLDLLLELSRED